MKLPPRTLAGLMIVAALGQARCGPKDVVTDATTVPPADSTLPTLPASAADVAQPATDARPPDERPAFGRGVLCGIAVGLGKRNGKLQEAQARVLLQMRHDAPRADRETCSRFDEQGCVAEVAWLEILDCLDPGSGTERILVTEVSEVKLPGKAPFGVTNPYLGHLLAHTLKGEAPATAKDVLAPGKLDLAMQLEGRTYKMTLDLQAATGADAARCPMSRFSLTLHARGSMPESTLGGVVLPCADGPVRAEEARVARDGILAALGDPLTPEQCQQARAHLATVKEEDGTPVFDATELDGFVTRCPSMYRAGHLPCLMHADESLDMFDCAHALPGADAPPEGKDR